MTTNPDNLDWKTAKKRLLKNPKRRFYYYLYTVTDWFKRDKS